MLKRDARWMTIFRIVAQIAATVEEATATTDSIVAALSRKPQED